MSAFYEEFGRNVRDAREAAELSQRQLAERLRITRSSVANIEAGRQRVLVHQAVEIADVLAVPVEQLLPRVQPLVDDDVLGLPTHRALREISDRWATFVPRPTN